MFKSIEPPFVERIFCKMYIYIFFFFGEFVIENEFEKNGDRAKSSEVL